MSVLFAAGMMSFGAGKAAATDHGFDIFSPKTLMLSGNVCLIGVDGERSWGDGGFGKLRYGGKSGQDTSTGEWSTPATSMRQPLLGQE